MSVESAFSVVMHVYKYMELLDGCVNLGGCVKGVGAIFSLLLH